MRIGLITVAFLVSFTIGIRAQTSVVSGWQKDMCLLSVQGDFAFAFLNYKKHAATLSMSLAADVDFMNYRHSGKASSQLGCQVGYTWFVWPDITEDYDKYVNSNGYRASDYDFLARYTYLSGALRTDVLAGLTIRDGDYYVGWEGRAYEKSSRELRVSVGLKLGGAVTIMLIRPVLALRFKACSYFFGHWPIEGGAFGLGLVLGWQRDP